MPRIDRAGANGRKAAGRGGLVPRPVGLVKTISRVTTMAVRRRINLAIGKFAQEGEPQVRFHPYCSSLSNKDMGDINIQSVQFAWLA